MPVRSGSAAGEIKLRSGRMDFAHGVVNRFMRDAYLEESARVGGRRRLCFRQSRSENRTPRRERVEAERRVAGSAVVTAFLGERGDRRRRLVVGSCRGGRHPRAMRRGREPRRRPRYEPSAGNNDLFLSRSPSTINRAVSPADR